MRDGGVFHRQLLEVGQSNRFESLDGQASLAQIPQGNGARFEVGGLRHAVDAAAKTRASHGVPFDLLKRAL